MNNALDAATWRKSTYSNGDGGNCLEVADGFPVIPVRDSKTPALAQLKFRPEAWTAFVASLKH